MLSIIIINNRLYINMYMYIYVFIQAYIYIYIYIYIYMVHLIHIYFHTVLSEKQIPYTILHDI